MAKYYKYNYLLNTTCYLPQMPVAMQSRELEISNTSSVSILYQYNSINIVLTFFPKFHTNPTDISQKVSYLLSNR